MRPAKAGRVWRKGTRDIRRHQPKHRRRTQAQAARADRHSPRTALAAGVYAPDYSVRLTEACAHYLVTHWLPPEEILGMLRQYAEQQKGRAL